MLPGLLQKLNRVYGILNAQWMALLRPIHCGPNIDWLGPALQDLSRRNKNEWGRRNTIRSLPYSVMQILLLSCFTDEKITWDNLWAKKNSYEKKYKPLIDIWNLLKFTSNEINTLVIKGMKFKIAIRYHFQSIKFAKIEKKDQIIASNHGINVTPFICCWEDS